MARAFRLAWSWLFFAGCWGVCVFASGCGGLSDDAQAGDKTAQAVGTVQVRAEDGVCKSLVDDRPVLEYRYPARGPKSYVSLLTTPSGVNVLRDSPPDHVYHHALMFAVGIDGVDYWAEGERCGIQVPEGDFQSVSERTNGHGSCRLSHTLRWQAPDGSAQLREKRTIELIQNPKAETATLVIWTSKLTVAEGRTQVELWGRPYFGLGLRFVESMDRNGKLFNSLGGTGVEETNNHRAPWCAYTAQADGKRVTVAVLDHPQNPRAPATWFTMDQPFAYISATLNLAGEKLVLTADKPIVLRYGVAVCDGALDAQGIQNLYSLFCEHVR